MGRKKAHVSSKSKCQGITQKKISSAKRFEINAQCIKLSDLTSNPIYESQPWENYLEISAVLEKIKRLEEMKIESSKRSLSIDKFIKWLKENGANIDGVSISKFPGYDLGLKAEENFDENQLMLEIPSKLMFSEHSAAPELISLKDDPLVQHMPQVSLALTLLIEKHKENSKWKPYIDMLPSQYNTVLYMSTNDMLELKGSPTLEAALKQCRNIARQYTHLSRLFQMTDNAVSDILEDVFTYEEYCWAVSTVMTRQNLVPCDDGELMYALVPMWDLCNHEEGRITTNFNEITNCCECFAMRDFKAGEQIFIYYGPMSNSELFVHSGFVCANNREDGFRLRLGISKSDTLQNERVELLGKLKLSRIGEFKLRPGTEPISDMLLAFLRVFSMRKSELDRWLQSDRVNDLKYIDCALDTVVEESVWKFLLTRLKLLIASYPTSLAEDEELLKMTLPQTRSIAIQLRVTEKRILHQVLQSVEAWIK